MLKFLSPLALMTRWQPDQSGLNLWRTFLHFINANGGAIFSSKKGLEIIPARLSVIVFSDVWGPRGSESWLAHFWEPFLQMWFRVFGLILLKLNRGRATNGALQFFGSLFFINVYLSILWFYYIEWYWRKCFNIVKWKNKGMYSLVYFNATSIFAQKRLKVYMWNAHLIKFNSETWFCAQE